MSGNVERDFGKQPVAGIIAAAGLRPHDLVAASMEPMTHKMVARACNGRRLTPNVQRKVLEALNIATGKDYTLKDLFTYSDGKRRLKASP
jgi:hypothetical protein